MSNYKIQWKGLEIYATLPLFDPNATQPEITMLVPFNEETGLAEHEVITQQASKDIVGWRGGHINVDVCFIVDVPGALDALRLKRCQFTLGMFEQQVKAALTILGQKVEVSYANVINSANQITEENYDDTAAIHKILDQADPLQFDMVDEHDRLSKYTEKGASIRSESIALIIGHVREIREVAGEGAGRVIGDPIEFNGTCWAKMEEGERQDTADHFAPAFLGPLMDILSSGAEKRSVKK